MGSLKASRRLAKLRVDSCGLDKKHVGAITSALNEIYCLHELVLEVRRPAVGLELGKKAAPLLSLKERLGLSKLLEDNKLMGPHRVEQWKLSTQLEEVSWVFATLCVNIPKHIVDAGMSAWDGEACAEFVNSVGLPQYGPSFKFNLTGSKMVHVQTSSLAQLGVASFDHQKKIISAVRSLREAYDRKQRVQKANTSWHMLLTNKQKIREALADEAPEEDEAPWPSRRSPLRHGHSLEQGARMMDSLGHDKWPWESYGGGEFGGEVGGEEEGGEGGGGGGTRMLLPRISPPKRGSRAAARSLLQTMHPLSPTSKLRSARVVASRVAIMEHGISASSLKSKGLEAPGSFMPTDTADGYAYNAHAHSAHAHPSTSGGCCNGGKQLSPHQATTDARQPSWELPPTPPIPHSHMRPKTFEPVRMASSVLDPPLVPASSVSCSPNPRALSRGVTSSREGLFGCQSNETRGPLSNAAAIRGRSREPSQDAAASSPPPRFVTPREHVVARTEKEIDLRLAAAAAVLQSSHAQSVGGRPFNSEQSQAERRAARRQASQAFSRGPTSNDRLRMILYDLMGR